MDSNFPKYFEDYVIEPSFTIHFQMVPFSENKWVSWDYNIPLESNVKYFAKGLVVIIACLKGLNSYINFKLGVGEEVLTLILIITIINEVLVAQHYIIISIKGNLG